MPTARSRQLPRLVMFDFDGTLADSFPWFAEVVDEAACKFGFRRIDRAEGERLRSLDAARIMRALEISPWKVPRIASFMRRRMREGIDRITLFPGIVAALHALREAGVELAVLTSNAEDNVRHVLGPAAATISHYACGISLFGKRGRIETLLVKTRQPVEAVVMVGDELRDHDAARAAGVAFAAVAWGYTHADALAAARPEFLLTQPESLATLLSGREG